MDLWVVAAAAGAGYIAKNLQNLTSSSVDKRENLGEPSSFFNYSKVVNSQLSERNLLQQLRDKTCPLRKLGGERTKGVDSFLEVEDSLGVSYNNGLSSQDLEASSSLKKVGLRGGYGYNDMGLISGTRLVFGVEEDLVVGEGESGKLSRMGKVGRIRKGRERLITPLSYLGSCVDAEMVRKDERLEEGVSGFVPSVAMARPMLVGDGSCVVSRSSSDSSFVQFEGFREELRRENGVCLKGNSTRLGAVYLEQFEAVEELQMNDGKCSEGAPGGSLHSQGPDGILLFIIGMTIGMWSAAMSGKKDVDELNKQLKQSQNLVQDLHEELDMKEMLTVKELINLGHPPPGETNTPPSIKDPISSPSYVKVDKDIAKFDSLKANDIAMENPELMSKIEAELQAELEMLEQNMEASARDRISDVLEPDPDFEPDISQGDLNSLMVNGNESESGNEATDTTTTSISQPVNYAVCPWELSFRLHELIEFRLEERIRELQTALDNSQKGVQFLGSRSFDFGKRSYYNGTEPSTPPNTYKKPNGISQKSEDYGIFVAHEEHTVLMEEVKSSDLVHDMPQILDTETWTSFMSNEDCRSEEEEDVADESEMLLIKKILERRKSGSYVAFKF